MTAHDGKRAGLSRPLHFGDPAFRHPAIVRVESLRSQRSDRIACPIKQVGDRLPMSLRIHVALHLLCEVDETRCSKRASQCS